MYAALLPFENVFLIDILFISRLPVTLENHVE